MRKAALHNLGCKVNAYETEAMQQLLEEAGYEIVPFQEKADVYVINTCSVTNIADRKSRQMLHRAKKMNPDAVVVAAGCYVQAAGEELKKDAAIDVIIGNNRKKDLVPLLDEYFAGKHVEEDSLILGKPESMRHFTSTRSRITPGHLSRSRTAVTSSAATASFLIPEEESEAESRKRSWKKSKVWWTRATGKWC